MFSRCRKNNIKWVLGKWHRRAGCWARGTEGSVFITWVLFCEWRTISLAITDYIPCEATYSVYLISWSDYYSSVCLQTCSFSFLLFIPLTWPDNLSVSCLQLSYTHIIYLRVTDQVSWPYETTFKQLVHFKFYSFDCATNTDCLMCM